MKAHAEPATDDVILVDEENKIIGRAPKFVAHTRGGLLHRAFSVVTVDNQKGFFFSAEPQPKLRFPACYQTHVVPIPRLNPQ